MREITGSGARACKTTGASAGAGVGAAWAHAQYGCRREHGRNGCEHECENAACEGVTRLSFELITGKWQCLITSGQLFLGLLALASSLAIATDPTQLQDFYVADNTSNIFLNGFVCKDPNLVNENDFLFRGLNQPGNTANQLGSKVTLVFVTQLPGLNTLGISLALIDFAPYGIIPPHFYSRASDILVVIYGTLAVGFVAPNNPDNMLFTNVVLNEGDVFVFLKGLIYFQLNTENINAVSISALSC
ncbi:hypothetical protein IEQ34_011097 [Dendrobium chrysotoxum]|uniref:Germin-like protein n=1 Tax=Dendrobium chrysotoxum TaxID=161865 RepID=A0AAV7GXB3_DENCH|nr:hypothetical protein IEQ34_011097 [Dendrobium chrysotoxum]